MSPESINQPQSSENEITALVAHIQGALTDRQQLKRLLEQRGADAQKLLDLFQWLLDTPNQDLDFKAKLIVTSQKLSKKSGLFPSCYDLRGIKQDGQHPVQAGGFADIYKGEFHGQKLCLKVLRTYQNTKIEDLLKRLSNEAILWGQLSHPNLLPFYGLYRLKTRICLVSPWMEAGEVSKYLQANPKVPRLPLALDVAQGLLYLHKNGAVHGDIKGPNVLVNDIGRACLTDFGISSVPNSGIIALTSDSYPASVGGSVRWQAPELFDAETENDEVVHNTVKSDVYGWASLCYEIFAGELPFSSITNEIAIMFRIKQGDRPSRPPDSSPPWREWGLTESIWSLMEWCWEADPAKRPSMEHVIIDLGKASRPGFKDWRLRTRGRIITPARFRKMMRKSPTDIMPASALGDLLSSSSDVESIDMPESLLGSDNFELAVADDTDGYVGESSPNSSKSAPMSPSTPSSSPVLSPSSSTSHTNKNSTGSNRVLRCQVCDATFKKQKSADRHMQTHTGDRPYKCRVCGKQFTRSDSLSKHVTRQHGERPSPTLVSSSEKVVLKAACDPCVQSGLSCNGHHPCSTCLQRKCHCSFEISRKNSASSIASISSTEKQAPIREVVISHPMARPDQKRRSSWQNSRLHRPSSMVLSDDSPGMIRSISEGSNVLSPPSGPSTPPTSPPILMQKRQPAMAMAKAGNWSPRPSARELQPDLGVDEQEVEFPQAFKRTSLVDMTIPEEPQPQWRRSGSHKNGQQKAVLKESVLSDSPEIGYKLYVGQRNKKGIGDGGGKSDEVAGMKKPRARRPHRSSDSKPSLRHYIQG